MKRPPSIPTGNLCDFCGLPITADSAEPGVPTLHKRHLDDNRRDYTCHYCRELTYNTRGVCAMCEMVGLA